MSNLDARAIIMFNPLQRLEPIDIPLLTLIFDHVDDSMLAEIANSDYGNDADIHLAALHQIRAKNIPIPMQWYPGEVLELTRWTEWDSLNPQDRVISTRNHWMRLFACTVLIWASLEPENYEHQGEYWCHIDGEDSTIIQFLDSALNLGDDTAIAALKFLAWRIECQMQRALLDEDFGNCPCYAVAMLLLYVSIVSGDSFWEHRYDPEIVSSLISVAHCDNEYYLISKRIDECQRSQKWRDTIQQILLDSTAPDYARSNPELQQFGMELLADKDQKIIDSWFKNATPWIVAIEQRQIESRNLVTDRSIVDAVVSRGGQTVLDLGCGEGWLTRALAAEGLNVLGTDIIPALIERARMRGLGRFELAAYADIAAGKLAKKFDVVVANFSLIGEKSVVDLLQSMPSLLNDHGSLIIQTLHPTIACGDLPYVDGWRASSWDDFSDEFTDPAPWYFRTIESWIELYNTNGLSIVEIREPIHPQTAKPAAMILIGVLRD
jgi:2-polyprenyl-3-methyl-5-hydroxy-6-metoxy-1,4-benzoquinol methylase